MALCLLNPTQHLVQYEASIQYITMESPGTGIWMILVGNRHVDALKSLGIGSSLEEGSVEWWAGKEAGAPWWAQRELW